MAYKISKSPNMRINKVYTRTGDKGKTRLVGGVERYKDDPRVKAYGSVDELNSHIGLCRELLRQTGREEFDDLISYLKIIQNELFNLGTQLASIDDARSAELPHLPGDAVEKLETEIDSANEVLSELKSFVLPGGSVLNAQFHITRNVCRRAERRAVSLSQNEKVAPENIRYLNRLSDALFVWSRWVSHILEDEENLWEPNK